MSRTERAETPGPPDRPAAAGGMPLAYELGGDLPCIRCRYNLRGLSIRAVCPECGMPLRATLLAVVDPLASEFKAIANPRLIAMGVVLWGFGALGAAVASFLDSAGNLVPELKTWLPQWGRASWFVAALAALSGVGAAAFIRPHDGIASSGRRKALLGVVLYVPLCLLLAYERGAAAWMPHSMWSAPSGAEAYTGIALCSLVVLILILLRPNARLLAARSLLMRSGRVDRQTMRTVAAVLGLCIAGYLCGIAAAMGSGPMFDLIATIGGLLLLVGWAMFLLGLAGIAYDCALLRGVIVDPPLTLTDLLSPDRGERAHRPSRTWSQRP